jgi:hypothetical protein
MERTALARTLNDEIRGASERFPEEEDVPLEFYCECGCWQTLALTIAQYDRRDGQPLYRDGHSIGRDGASQPADRVGSRPDP